MPGVEWALASSESCDIASPEFGLRDLGASLPPESAGSALMMELRGLGKVDGKVSVSREFDDKDLPGDDKDLRDGGIDLLQGGTKDTSPTRHDS